MTHTRGDTRPDGYRFWSFEKRCGRFREKWLNPESYERQLESTRIAWRNWKRKRQQVTYS